MPPLDCMSAAVAGQVSWACLWRFSWWVLGCSEVPACAVLWAGWGLFAFHVSICSWDAAVKGKKSGDSECFDDMPVQGWCTSWLVHLLAPG